MSNVSAGPPTAAGVQAISGSFRERLHPPVWWWFIASGIWISVAVAVGAYLNLWWSLGLTAAVMALTGGFIVQQAEVVTADAQGLSVGRNRVDYAWIGGAEPLTAEQTASYLTSTQHHADFLAVRPYVSTAVRVALADPADPHPSWLVSTRHPDRLAAVIDAGVAGAGSHHG